MTTATRNDNVAIARTILTQLGGGRFKAMTGASQFMTIENGLRIKFPNRAAGMPNMVTITLRDDDTYKMEFHRLRGSKVTLTDGFSGVYCDQLQPLFEDATGLYVSL